MIGGLTAAGAGLGARGIRRRPNGWYAGLVKPSWTPPPAAFGVAWSGLYALMAASGMRVLRAPASRARSTALLLWCGQLAANAAFSWLFFGRRDIRAGMADTLLSFGLTAAYVLTVRNVDRAAALMMVPQLAWTGYASALATEIVRRN